MNTAREKEGSEALASASAMKWWVLKCVFIHLYAYLGVEGGKACWVEWERLPSKLLGLLVPGFSQAAVERISKKKH